MYLVFACESYASVAFKFPAGLPITTADGVRHKPNADELYHCAWDPLAKVYTLMFVIGRTG